MKKILAVLFACSIVLAGCMDLTDEDVEAIVDAIVEIPGCNANETAYNYDANAPNNNACLTETVLKQSVTDFVNLMDNGPAWGEIMGVVTEGSETDSDGATTSFSTTVAMSPDGMYTMVEMDMGMMDIEIGELMTKNADGTTNIQTTWMGNTYQMNSEAIFDDYWNEQYFLDDKDSEDDMDDGMDDDMDMGDDMDMDLGLPDTEVSLPEDFDPATALYEAGLSTSTGYSFTTNLEHDVDHTTSMTFTLSLDLTVTNLVMVETYDGMTTTSSINMLDADTAEALLVNDETLVEFALPFTLAPMGNHDGHGDDGDSDNGQDLFLCDNGNEVPMHWVNDGMNDCGDGSDETNHSDDGHDGHSDDGNDDYSPEELLADADTDGSEGMSFDEFEIVFSSGDELSQEMIADLQTIFDSNDADASGEIELSEMESFMNDIDAYIISLDENDDGMDDGSGQEESYYYDNCVNSDDGLSSLDCWTNEMDVDGDGIPEDNDSYWNYECQELADGTWECMTDHINYYDNCEDDQHESDLECWLDEWDTDNDGSYDLGSDGYMDYECEQLEDGRWACGHTDVIEVFQNYDYCEEESGMYECWTDEWVDSDGHVAITDDYELGDCSELENSTWDCFIGYEFVNDETDDDYGEGDLFTAADSDNDGLVTTSDIVDAILSMEAPTPQEALEDGDMDQSDNISWDEFVQMWNMEEDENDLDDDHLNNNPQLESDLHAAFNNSDSDYDGNLSIDELQSFIDDVTTISSTQEEITEMITIFTPYVSCVDGNNDGSLDQQEFSDFYGAVMYGMDNNEIVFCTLDSNNDDTVTVSEYVDFMNQTGMYSDENPMTEEDWESFTSLLGMYDTDGVEGLSLSEYQSMMEDISPGGGGDMFICDNGGEVPQGYVDDGDNDCGDWSDEPNYNGGGDDGHGDNDHSDHDMQYDWMIQSADMMSETEIIGAFADYEIVLANCADDSSDMMGASELDCGEDVMKITIADATVSGAQIMFHDTDMSGSITQGDMIHIDQDIDAGGQWNTVRLYSASTQTYSDENPMLPGFGAAAGLIALLGAALLTRRD